MTLQSPPFALQGGTYTALSDRLHLVTTRTLRDFSVAHRSRQGFFPDRFPAYSNPSGMDVVIGPGAGVVANTFASDAGDYNFSNPSNLTLTPAASSPTQNRHDILGFRVLDHFYDSSGQNSIVPAVIQGTNAAGSPSDPALPASFIPVVRAVINATVTSPTLQDMRVKTVPSGGLLPIGSDTERTAIGTPHAGMVIPRTDKTYLEFFNGTAWVRLNQRRMGTTTATVNSAAITAKTVVDTITVTNLIVGRRYAVVYAGSAFGSAATQELRLTIHDGLTTADPDLHVERYPVNTTPNSSPLNARYEFVAASTSKSFAVSFERAVGAGTITRFAVATKPTYLFVEDVD